ncbi:MAG: SEC-C metal-binding domain-containing protein [Candidatus Promineifilaceae bacterium]|jgi:hypothetical protein
MKIIVSLLRAGRLAEEVMPILAKEAIDLQTAVTQAGRNDLCPCGSGLKTKQCHGRKRTAVTPEPIKLNGHQAQPRMKVMAVSDQRLG